MGACLDVLASDGEHRSPSGRSCGRHLAGSSVLDAVRRRGGIGRAVPINTASSRASEFRWQRHGSSHGPGSRGYSFFSRGYWSAVRWGFSDSFSGESHRARAIPKADATSTGDRRFHSPPRIHCHQLPAVHWQFVGSRTCARYCRLSRHTTRPGDGDPLPLGYAGWRSEYQSRSNMLARAWIRLEWVISP